MERTGMYKVVRMERQDDSVFRDDFQFTDRKEAESFYSGECKRPSVVDIRLFYCSASCGERELSRFVRHNKSVRGRLF